MSQIAFIIACAAGAFAGLSVLLLVVSTLGALACPLMFRLRTVPAPTLWPPVSVVIPVKALDAGFDAAQISAFMQDYPDFEIIVTAVDLNSPAVAAVRKIFALYPHVQTRIVAAEADFAASPKVNNLYGAINKARHDLIVMKDSNVALPQGGIAAAVTAKRPGIGLVVAVPEACEAQTFAAQIEQQIMNQSHGRLLLFAASAGLGFGVGKLMVFSRQEFTQAGGFEAIAHSVGEDSALAHAFAAINLRTVFMAPVVMQRLGARQLADVFQRQLRWTVIRRHNETFAFALEPLGLVPCAVAAAALSAGLAGLSPLAAGLAVLVAWSVAETALALARGWPVSMSAPVVMVARDMLMLGVWLRAWTTDRVMWAQERMNVARDFAPPPESPPAASLMSRATADTRTES